VIIGNEIYSGYHGDPAGTSTTNTKLYLQKTSLDGNLLWLKQYDLPGNTDFGFEIIESNNGLVVLAENRASPRQLFMFKVNLSGDVEWAKTYSLSIVSNSDTYYYGRNQLIQIGDQLLFTGYGSSVDNRSEMLVVRTDLNGEVLNPCVISDNINIGVTNVSNPVFYSVDLVETDAVHDIRSFQPNPTEFLIQPDERCLLVDTLFTFIDAAICEGQQYEGHTESGIYEDHFISSGGCDSVRILNLTVQDIFEYSIEKTICHGDVFEGYDETGIYTDTVPTNTECDSIRKLSLRVIECKDVVWYNLNACTSFMSNGSHMDYSEFEPEYPNAVPCAEVSASHVFRDPPQMNKHSCTPGVNNSIAMCISSNPSCTYLPGDAASLVFELNIIPGADSVVQISGLNFFEKAPPVYSWISGPTGPNNYPKFYGIRILKNGTEILRIKDIPTGQAWSLQSFDFVDLGAFRISEPALLRFELLPYCPVGNGALVSAWDIDEIRISAGCWPSQVKQPIISGTVTAMDGRKMRNVQMDLSTSPDFIHTEKTITDDGGNYQFNQLAGGMPYFLRGSQTDALLNGVNTFDLLKIQKHLLGLEPFTHPHQFIAADVNHSATVTVMDIVDLRKALLGKISAFPSNTSWRFGSFDGNNNWNEIQWIGNIKQDVVLNWNGIKVGDLNDDVILNVSENNIQSRTAVTFELGYMDKQVVGGEEFEVSLANLMACDLEGFQFIVKTEGLELIDAKGINIDIDNEQYQLHQDGSIWISWSQPSSVHLDKNDELFSLKFLATKSGSVSDMMQLVNDPLQPQAYFRHDIAKLELKNLSPKAYSAGAIGDISFHPNPFSETTTIEVEMLQPGRVQFAFYDLSGRMIYSVEALLPGGKQHIVVRRKDLGSEAGIITCQMVCQTQVITNKLVMMH